MPDPNPLPQSVENVIIKICNNKGIDPPDSWARQRLAAVGETAAIEILSKIYNKQEPIRDLSRLIVWYINNPQSPVRVSLQQSSQTQSPSNNPFQSPRNLAGHPLQSPSNNPFQSPQSLAEHIHLSPSSNPFQSPQSLFGHETRPNNPSPLKRAFPSLCDYVHASVASSSTSKDSGSSNFHMSSHPTPLLVPFSEMAVSNKVSRQLSFSGEPEIRERWGPNISHQLTVLTQLEFRKFFLLLSYIGRKKLEEVISPEAADDIVRRKDLSMGDFELQIWNTYGQHFCEKLDVRREYADWESSRTYFYYCHVYGDGSFSFEGPCLNATKTHLQRKLGDDNVLIVKFVGEGKHVTKIAKEGILVGLRHYRFFVFKEEINKKKDRLEKDKSSTFGGTKCYFVRFNSLAPHNGSEPYILSSKSTYEARCLFMHIHMVSSMAKYMARFSLILSKTIKLPVDLSTVKVERIEDIHCCDVNGCIIIGEDEEPLKLTDGTGFISEDLALQCPENLGRAKSIRDRDFERFRDYIEAGNVREVEATSKEPPLLMQCRLFKDGYAFKGTLLVNRKLPPRTIQVRKSMRKVKRDKRCLVTGTFNSLEIVKVSNKPKRTYLSRNLISLLNYGGVPRSFFLDLVISTLQETQKVYSNLRAALRVASINGEVDDDSTALRMISAGVPLSEPYLQDRLSKLVNRERNKLKKGKLPITESFYLIGTADPSGVLNPNEVCVTLDNGQISGKVLVYRNPGLHFGDIHILEAVYVKELEEIVGNAKYGIFFSTKGQRSAAAEIANGDFDGDLYWVSRNPQLLRHFRASEPWSRVYSTPQAVNRKPTEFSPEELEDELVQLFLQTKESSNPGMAANSWLIFMDRLLILGDDCANEKDILKNKMLKLIDIYYDALDAPKSGKKIKVPSDLIAKRYPHYMQKDSSCSYHSTSILGEIYDKVGEFQSNAHSVGEIQKLPEFDVVVPEKYLSKWRDLYNQYRHEMVEALNKPDLRNSAADKVIKKYKQLLYEAEDFQKSRKDVEELYNEARAIYHLSYNLAIKKEDVGKCAFAWKVAGAALCSFHASRKKENPIQILPSVLRNIFL